MQYIKTKLNQSSDYRNKLKKELSGKIWPLKVERINDGYIQLANEVFDKPFSVLKKRFAGIQVEKGDIVKAEIHLVCQNGSWDYVISPFPPTPMQIIIKNLDCVCREDKLSPDYTKAEKYFAGIEQSNLNEDQRIFAKKVYKVIEEERNSEASRLSIQSGGTNEKSTASKIAEIDALLQQIEEKKQKIQDCSPKKQRWFVKEFYQLYRRLERIQLDWKWDVFPDDTLLFDGAFFTGVIENKNTSGAFVRCDYFKGALFLSASKIKDGGIIENGQARFQIKKDKRYPNPQCVNVCVRIKKFKPYIRELSCELSEKDFSDIDQKRQEQPVLVKCEQALMKNSAQCLVKRFGQNAVFSGHKIAEISKSFISKKFFENYILICADSCDSKADYVKNIRKTLYHCFARKIIEAEKDSWVILMDETGNCRDHIENKNSYRQGHLQNSVMMALIIPSGVSLPPCPLDYHSTDSGAVVTRKLRETIVNTDGVISLVFPYHKAEPYAPENEQTPSLHGQMWRHAICLCLEYIAQQIPEHTKSADIRFYIEEYSGNPQWTPESNALSGFVDGVLEPMQKRKDWKKLQVPPPKIVAKNVHPWMGYVDCLGHAYRTYEHLCSQEELELFEQIRSHHTIQFPYDQKALQYVDTIIKESGENPDEALLKLLRTEAEIFESFQNILNLLAKKCINRLSVYELEAIISQISESLSKRPKCTAACSVIIELIAGRSEPLSEPKRFELEMNRMLVCNRQGNTEKGAQIIADLKTLSDLNKNKYYRILANELDHYHDSLAFDRAIQNATSYLGKARGDMNDIPTACHFLGTHMQTLAHVGKTRDAIDLWKDILQKQQAHPADKLRYVIYGMHLYYDLGKFDTALDLALGVHKIGFKNLGQAVQENNFLAHALLKLYATLLKCKMKKLIQKINNQFLCLESIYAPEGHPGELINFWSLMALKAQGRDYISPLEALAPELGKEVSCEALELIMTCIGEQLVRDNIIKKDILRYTFENGSPVIKERLKAFPVNDQSPFPCLEPLRCNFR